MSWTGTVRCGYCGDEGHNRRKCPEMEKAAERNPDGYQAWEIENRKKNKSPRRCGYCKGTGHNKKTCERRKLHLHHLAKVDAKYRDEIIALMREKSFGPGAFVIFPKSPQSSMMITHIQWDHISIISTGYGSSLVRGWRAVIGQPLGRKNQPLQHMEIEGVLDTLGRVTSDGGNYYIEGLSPKLAEKYFKNLQVKPNTSLHETYVDNNGATDTHYYLRELFGITQEELAIEEPTY